MVGPLQKLLAIIVFIGTLAASLSLIGWSVLSDLVPPDSASSDQPIQDTAPTAPPVPAVDMAQLSPLLNRRLQGRPTPKATAPAPVNIAPAVKLPPQLQLTGILFSKKGSVALFSAGNQSISLVEGEAWSGVEVTAINQSDVRVRYRETDFTLTIDGGMPR